MVLKTKQRGGMGGRGRGKAGCLLSGLPFLTGSCSEYLAAWLFSLEKDVRNGRISSKKL